MEKGPWRNQANPSRNLIQPIKAQEFARFRRGGGMSYFHAECVKNLSFGLEARMTPVLFRSFFCGIGSA
jgi:hypothetical protein